MRMMTIAHIEKLKLQNKETHGEVKHTKTTKKHPNDIDEA
jgi:hypothetical protein